MSAAGQSGRSAEVEKEMLRLQKELSAKSVILGILEESMDRDVRGTGQEGSGRRKEVGVGTHAGGSAYLDEHVQREREALEQARTEMERERAEHRTEIDRERQREAEEQQRAREEWERERVRERGESAREMGEVRAELAGVKAELAGAAVAADDTLQALR